MMMRMRMRSIVKMENLWRRNILKPFYPRILNIFEAMGIYWSHAFVTLQDDERASKRRREADRRMRSPKWATLGIGQCWKFVCQIPTIISFGGSMSFKSQIQEFGILWRLHTSIYFNEAFWSWISLQIFVKCFFFSGDFPLYPCWLIYRLFGAIFFWNPRRGEMPSLASFMRFDRFFRCDTTKPPAGKSFFFWRSHPKFLFCIFVLKRIFGLDIFFLRRFDLKN